MWLKKLYLHTLLYLTHFMDQGGRTLNFQEFHFFNSILPKPWHQRTGLNIAAFRSWGFKRNKNNISCKHLTLVKQNSMRKWSKLRNSKQNLVWPNTLRSCHWDETDTPNNQLSITRTAWYCRTNENRSKIQSQYRKLCVFSMAAL